LGEDKKKLIVDIVQILQTKRTPENVQKMARLSNQYQQ